MDLDVVIVSHRDERSLEACLNSLEKARGACTYRTTIVENGGSPISLTETSTRRVLYTANRGFAAALLGRCEPPYRCRDTESTANGSPRK